jgi:hypothetical protein
LTVASFLAAAGPLTVGDVHFFFFHSLEPAASFSNSKRLPTGPIPAFYGPSPALPTTHLQLVLAGRPIFRKKDGLLRTSRQGAPHDRARRPHSGQPSSCSWAAAREERFSPMNPAHESLPSPPSLLKQALKQASSTCGHAGKLPVPVPDSLVFSTPRTPPSSHLSGHASP